MQLMVSWPGADGATLYNVQVYDVVTKEHVYNGTVQLGNSACVPRLSNAEPSSHYVFYITGVGDEDQRGNTVSCAGTTRT